MKKLFVLFAAVCGCMMAQAEEINAISATQGTTTDWYPFGESDRIEVIIDELGNPVFPGDKLYDLADGNVETAFGIAPIEKITLTAADFTVTKDGDWVYDKTEKRVNVEFISVENPGPPADKITIYYNNDKLVRPINPGTYQVYIDIEETDTYAAVTGITSEAWKFDIIDPLPAIKEAAIAEIKNVATHNKNSILEYAVADQVKETAINEIDKAVAEAEASINNADSEEQVNDAKNNALNKINIQLANVQDYYIKLQAAIAEIKVAANDAKEEIDGLGVDESAKSEAKAQIDNIAHTAEATINAATSKDAIDKAKTEAIAKIHDVVQTTKNMWVTIRTDGAAGNWNTICLERNITAIDGATFWTVSGQDATSFILDEVTEPEAGQGYLIRFTAAELKVKYGDQVAATPVPASDGNPVQGTFTQIDFDQDGQNELVGNYVVYQNQLCKVEAWVGLLANRAYVVTEYVPNNVPAPAPNRARMYLPKPNNTPTDNPSLHHSVNSSFKMIKDGQLVIVRDGKMFNAQGQMLQ